MAKTGTKNGSEARGPSWDSQKTDMEENTNRRLFRLFQVSLVQDFEPHLTG